MNQVIDVAVHETAIGRKPRGYGLWRFMIGAMIYRHTGTFANATKSALALALHCNVSNIKLWPPSASGAS